MQSLKKIGFSHENGLIETDPFDILYRKDRTNHGGGVLMYLFCELAFTRVTVWRHSGMSHYGLKLR